MANLKHNIVKGSTKFNNGVTKEVSDAQIAQNLYNEAKLQQDVNDWNSNYVGKKRVNGDNIMDAMKNIQLHSGNLIVQAYKLDVLPAEKFITDENGKIRSWVFSPALIDVRRHPTDPESLAPSPIPTIYKGVVIGIDPNIIINFTRRRDEMIALGMDVSNYVIPEVGSTVYLNNFMTKDNRFYIDKHSKERNLVVSPRNFSLENFDMTFKLTEFHIESIVRKGKEHTMPDYIHPYANVINEMTENNILSYFSNSK